MTLGQSDITVQYPDGTSRSAGFVTCASREKAAEAVEKLNMKLTLEGARLPLAVKFSGDGAPSTPGKQPRTDFDAPVKDGK